MEKNKEGIGNKGKEGFADLKGWSVPPSSKGSKESQEQATWRPGGRVLPARDQPVQRPRAGCVRCCKAQQEGSCGCLEEAYGMRSVK